MKVINKLKNNDNEEMKLNATNIVVSNGQNNGKTLPKYLQKEIITICANAAQEISKSTNFTDINLTKVYSQVGNKLKMQSNNGDVFTIQDCLGWGPSDYYYNWNFPPKLVEVSEDDTFFMQIDGNSDLHLNQAIGNFSATFLTVEVID